MASRELYQEGTKEADAAKQKLEAFKEANPFDIKPTGDIESGMTPGKFTDPKKQKEYQALLDTSYQASDKKDKAKKDYQTADNTQEYKINKFGQETRNLGDVFAKKDVLISRFGYKESDLLNEDGKSLSSAKITQEYDKKIKEDLLSPVSKSNVPNAIAPTSTDANIAQGQGQELKSGPAGIGANQPAPTSKTDATIAPTKASKVDIQFSEMKFAQNDQENYKKFSKDKKALTEEYAKKQASTYGRKEPNQIDYEIAGMKAKTDTIVKYRKEIEASGAGKVTGGDLTPSTKSESAQLTPAQPTTGEKMTKQSNENTMAKTEAMTGGNNVNTSIVSAPKVTNATNVTNAPINVRNNENTFVRNQNRIHDF